MPVLFGGHNLPPLVEIGSTDLPKSGDAVAPPATPGDKANTTGPKYLLYERIGDFASQRYNEKRISDCFNP